MTAPGTSFSARAENVIVGSPTIGAPSLCAWMPFEKLDRALRNIAANAYFKQRHMAGLRGIGWRFTMRSWWTFWAQSGKWEQRGCGMGRYQMCRLGPDKGDYAPDNVKIATHEENVRERSPEVHMAGIRRRGESWRTNMLAATSEALKAYRARGRAQGASS